MLAFNFNFTNPGKQVCLHIYEEIARMEDKVDPNTHVFVFVQQLLHLCLLVLLDSSLACVPNHS